MCVFEWCVCGKCMFSCGKFAEVNLSQNASLRMAGVITSQLKRKSEFGWSVTKWDKAVGMELRECAGKAS